MDTRKVHLVKNTTILAIGNFSSRILSFLLVPLYTFYLKPSDFGQVDVYLTVLLMLYIVVSLQSIESSFRFIQDCATDKEKTITFTNAFITAITGIGIYSIVMLVINYIIDFQYTLIFILYVATNILANLMLHTLRGMNRITTYAVIGVIQTIVQVLFNVLFIVGFGTGAISLIYTPIITNVIVILILVIFSRILNFFKLNQISRSVIKKQLKFSLPLIPNAIGIWLMSSLGRFVLLFFYGTTEVGLLAFALKFPLLLISLNSIFFMAWQMSAISEYNSSDRDIFASEIFHEFSKLLLSSILLLLPLIKIAIFTIMGKSYIEAWIYIPAFLVGVIFYCYAQFYSMGFFGAKKTKQVFYSIAIGCFVYIAIGLLLAKPLYILGVGIAYLASEIIYWLYMKKTVSPYMKIKINWKQQLLFLVLIGIFTIVYYTMGLWAQVSMALLGFVNAIFVNRKLMMRLIMHLKK